MPRIITYSLTPDTVNSDEYYQTISVYANAWLAQTRLEVCDLVTGFREFWLARGEVHRSDTEYIFELLTLGVLLREHGKEASIPPKWTERVMHWLIAFQEQHPRAEKTIKALRGWLGWFGRGVSTRTRGENPLEALILWLAINDEMVKAQRLRQWETFLSSKDATFLHNATARCLVLAEKFAGTSQAALGKYTRNVERFLAEETPRYRHRYDVRLVSHTRLDYHLGMLGTELQNQAFRQRFLATQRKMVILPPCMCAPVKICKAVVTPLGAKCQACTPGCRVNQITKLGEKRGFDVTMIPDDVKIFSSGEGMESVGLVGVSCALTNWNGGWETGTLGIPAQGALLDYVGCKFHWDKEGIPTDLNLKKLEEILGI